METKDWITAGLAVAAIIVTLVLWFVERRGRAGEASDARARLGALERQVETLDRIGEQLAKARGPAGAHLSATLELEPRRGPDTHGLPSDFPRYAKVAIRNAGQDPATDVIAVVHGVDTYVDSGGLTEAQPGRLESGSVSQLRLRFHFGITPSSVKLQLRWKDVTGSGPRDGPGPPGG